MSYIVVEGIDGSGKSYLCNVLQELFERDERKVFGTSELPRTGVGEALNNIVKSDDYNVKPLTECLLFYAGRYEHINSIVKPKLKEGYTVISDRSHVSSLAYNFAGRRCHPTSVVDHIVMGEVKITPDIYIFVDVDVKVALERVKHRGVADRLERTIDMGAVKGYYRKFFGSKMGSNGCKVFILENNGCIESFNKGIISLYEKIVVRESE